MDKTFIKDWWEYTKKDFKEFIDCIPFFSCIIGIIYFVVFSSPERMELAQAIIDSKQWLIMVCIGGGIMLIAAGLEKVVRFIIASLWFILSCTALYIYRKIKS